MRAAGSLSSEVISLSHAPRIASKSAVPPPLRKASTPAAELLGIVTVVLGQIHMACKAENKRAIQSAPHDLMEKLNRGFLFESKPRIYRRTGVHHKPEPQRQVTLIAEGRNSRHRPVIVENADIFFFQSLDKLASIGSSKEEGDFIHPFAKSPGIGRGKKHVLDAARHLSCKATTFAGGCIDSAVQASFAILPGSDRRN